MTETQIWAGERFLPKCQNRQTLRTYRYVETKFIARKHNNQCARKAQRSARSYDHNLISGDTWKMQDAPWATCKIDYSTTME